MATEQKLEDIIRTVIQEMGADRQEKKSGNGGGVGIDDYPLGEKRQDLLRTPQGNSYQEVTLENVLNGKITADDLRISAETLKMQAQIAEEAGRGFFTANLNKAAEMTKIPDDRLIAIYNTLRPRRSTKEELLSIARELEDSYQAKLCASYVREAANVYERRRLLRTE